MSAEPLSNADLERLAGEWKARFDESLAAAQFSAEELLELAGRQRDLAAVTDSAGQKRALLRVAEQYEHAARERSAA